MNTANYPSLDLCKKLTEFDFPKTEMEYTEFTPIWNFEETEIVDFKKGDWHIMGADFTEGSGYKCPSVMELLDKMQWEYKLGFKRFEIKIEQGYYNGVFYVVSFYIDEEWINQKEGTLPDALAEMYLWLKKNNYLP